MEDPVNRFFSQSVWSGNPDHLWLVSPSDRVVGDDEDLEYDSDFDDEYDGFEDEGNEEEEEDEDDFLDDDEVEEI